MADAMGGAQKGPGFRAGAEGAVNRSRKTGSGPLASPQTSPGFRHAEGAVNGSRKVGSGELGPDTIQHGFVRGSGAGNQSRKTSGGSRTSDPGSPALEE